LNFLGKTDAGPGASALIDEFRIYNKALTPEEVLQSYAEGPNLIPEDCSRAKLGGYGLTYDLNGDCYLDLLELAIIVNDWLNCVDPASGLCDTPWL
jgi:hypothetical protein